MSNARRNSMLAERVVSKAAEGIKGIRLSVTAMGAPVVDYVDSGGFG
jgi:hypothetical protein